MIALRVSTTIRSSNLFFYLFDAYGINNIWEAFILKKDDDNFKAVIVKIIVKIIR